MATAISGVVALAGTAAGQGSVAQSATPAPFSELFNSTLQEVGQLDEQAQKTIGQLMTGTGVDVHQAMIAAEKASLAFEMVLAVRNKAVSAYQQVMNMQF